MDELFGENREEGASSEMRGKQMWGGCERQKKKKEEKKERANHLETCRSFLLFQ